MFRNPRSTHTSAITSGAAAARPRSTPYAGASRSPAPRALCCVGRPRLPQGPVDQRKRRVEELRLLASKADIVFATESEAPITWARAIQPAMARELASLSSFSDAVVKTGETGRWPPSGAEERVVEAVPGAGGAAPVEPAMPQLPVASRGWMPRAPTPPRALRWPRCSAPWSQCRPRRLGRAPPRLAEAGGLARLVEKQREGPLGCAQSFLGPVKIGHESRAGPCLLGLADHASNDVSGSPPHASSSRGASPLVVVAPDIASRVAASSIASWNVATAPT